MIRIISGDSPDIQNRRGTFPDMDSIRTIIKDVQDGGDEALLSYEQKFSGHDGGLRVTPDEIQQAYAKTPDGVMAAIRRMAELLRRTEKTLLDTLNSVPAYDGMSRSFLPIPSAGCYIPGGKARYPSSAVMSIIPAAVAGVNRIVAVTPPSSSGADAATIAAADHCGAHEIYHTGGAQAVAAMAYGTQTMASVNKIVGPGGGVVTAAKRLVSPDVQIDMEAGPTELGILADAGADPDLIALDMISQAEHSADTFCFALTDSADVANGISASLEARMGAVSRSDIVRQSICENGFVAVFEDMAAATDAAERLAPEHLQIMAENPKKYADKLRSPGLILLGPDTPSAASDYMLGSNHILPTGGQGMLRGPLSVLDYVKMRVTMQVGKNHMAGILQDMQAITNSEGLANHYEAASVRVQ